MESWRDDADPARSVRRRDERGATAVEYAIMLSAIAGAIVATVLALGPVVAQLFQDVLDNWP